MIPRFQRNAQLHYPLFIELRSTHSEVHTESRQGQSETSKVRKKLLMIKSKQIYYVNYLILKKKYVIQTNVGI